MQHAKHFVRLTFVILAMGATVAGLSSWKRYAMVRAVEADSAQIEERIGQVRQLFQQSFDPKQLEGFTAQLTPLLAGQLDLYILNRAPDGRGDQVLFNSRLANQSSNAYRLKVNLPDFDSTQILGFTYWRNLNLSGYRLVFERSYWTVSLQLFALGGVALGLIFFIYQAFLRGTRGTLVLVPWYQTLSVRLGFATVLLALLVQGLIWFQWSNDQKDLQWKAAVQSAEKKGEVLSFWLAQLFLDSYSFEYFDRFLPQIKKYVLSDSEISRVRLLSPQGQIFFDSALPNGQSSVDRALASLSEQSVDVRGNSQTEAGKFWFRNTVGAVRVEVLFDLLRQRQSLEQQQYAFLIKIWPGIVLAFLMALYFSRSIVGALTRLQVAFNQVSLGDYQIQLSAKRTDELGGVERSFNAMVSELRKKTELQRFLPESVKVRESWSSSRVKAAVLFSDIRDFVSLCDELEPVQVTELLNDYFSEMADVIRKHGGEVDKFIGDAILAVFYHTDESPIPRAVLCALEMRQKLSGFNEKRLLLGQKTIATGIGINYGELISGSLGAKERMDYTVIGDVVNMAARIEKFAKTATHTGIIFTQAIKNEIDGWIEYTTLEVESIKGKSGSWSVFEVVKLIPEPLLVTQKGLSQNPKAVLEVLGFSQNPDAIPTLIEMSSISKQTDEAIRLAAILALRYFSKNVLEREIDSFYKNLEEESSVKCISAWITLIGKNIPSERDGRILKLIPYLNGSDERCIANAVEALGLSGYPESLDAIAPLLRHSSNRVRANTALAFLENGKLEVLQILKPWMLHSDPLMRSSACFVLGELGYYRFRSRFNSEMAGWIAAELQEVIPMLAVLLKDKNDSVVRQALVALSKIQARSSILPLLDLLPAGRTISPEQRATLKELSKALRYQSSHPVILQVIEKLC